MDSAFSSPELALLVAGVVATGIIAGLLAGLLGVGGGIVIVPVLFWVFTFVDLNSDIAMQMAVATSLLTIVFTSISSSRSHWKKGAVDTALLKRWAPFMGLGALTGGTLAGIFEPELLTGVFGFIGLAVAINMAIPKTLVIADALPGSRIVQSLIAYVIGTISSMMGIGAGTLSVPTLSAFSYPIHRAVGTAAALGLVIAVPAVISLIVLGWSVPNRPPFSLGYVNLAAAAILLPFTTFFAPYGARLAHSLDARWVKRAFAVFLAITAIRMLMATFS
jgi:uncharacterized protein